MELLPPQQIAFQRMLDTIRRGYERFGYLPVETPAFELADILLTKSGGETEKQVYFVQSTGSLANGEKPDMALRFDLTVPLARYVAEHEHQLVFPFKRYQIQRVYRGERAQKGRYREFYQCDIDVIGKDTLPIAYDAEVPAIIYGIFQELGLPKVTIKLNNRRLLRSLLESHGIPADKHGDVLHEVDRLGKTERGKVEESIAKIAGDSAGKLLDTLQSPLSALPESPGRSELQAVYDRARALGVPEDCLKIDLAIARGLDYYTGTVYETFVDGHEGYGSICSGGRYDNLAEHYTKSKLPGVGISIGATRLFSLLQTLGLVQDKATTAHVLVLNIEPALGDEYARIAGELRASGLNVEVYGVDAKMDKQFKYADRSGVAAALLYGSSEKTAGIVKLKLLSARTEHEIPRGELAARVKALLSV